MPSPVPAAALPLSARRFCVCLFVVLFARPLAANGEAASPTPTAPMTHQIDAHFARLWGELQIRPEPLCDDAEFLRRLSLDVIGRIPTSAEVREFLAAPAASRRAVWIERLVASPAHSLHRANVWRRILLPQASAAEYAALALPFEAWLQKEFSQGTPYDRLITQLLTATHSDRETSSAAMSFLAVGERKPENLAASSSRLLLGVNLDCAQCHDHPFARWSNRQFWEFAAFFVALTGETEAAVDAPAALTIRIPQTDQIVAARWLSEEPVVLPSTLQRDTGRNVLAAWITSPSNPYFARNAVNRTWAALLGRGLVEPLDDLSASSRSEHAPLLDELARAFAESGFDLSRLTQAIVASQVYQLSSAATVTRDLGSGDTHFARMAVRGLSGEQLYASLRTTAGFPFEPADPVDRGGARERQRIVASFATDQPANAQRSILQTLELMNGPLGREWTNSPTVTAIASSPFLNRDTQLKAVCVAALGRPPGDEELAELRTLVPDRGSLSPEHLGGVFWVLVNSTEFSTNH